MKSPKSRISLSPGNFKGLKGKTPSVSALKVKEGQVAAPANIAKALGVSIGMPVHGNALHSLFNHPDMGVSSTAKRLYGNMNQHHVKQSKTPY